MFGKRYQTLVIMPSAPGRRIIKISIPTYTWWIFSVVVIGLSLWAGIGTWSVTRHYDMAQQCFRLEKENAVGRTHLANQRKKIDYLNERIRAIQAQSHFIKKYLGIESQEATEGRLGQGGEEITPSFLTNTATIQSSETMSKDGTDRPKTGTLSYASRQDVRLLLDDLDRIVEELEKRQRALAYTPSVSPVDPGKAWISSHYGVRISPFTGKKQFHLGVDVAGWKGTPIMATAKGEVISVKKQKLLGLVVKLEHDKTFSTIYGHLLRAAVKKGERVERGQIIGYMGNSGRSTGYHVHYGVKKNDRYVNPIGYMMDWDDKKALFAEKR